MRSERAHVEIKPLRLVQTLEEIGRVGRENDGAVTRLCVTPTEQAAHDVVADAMADADMEVEVDAFGNTIGRRPGRLPGPVIAFGSHVDSVPRGGNFDGAAGVVAALEVVRALNEADIETEHPLMVVCFSAEEGARFGTPCLGSKSAVGQLRASDLQLTDRAGVTLGEAMEEMGRRPDEAVRPAPWIDDVGVFLELHIEQGRILESAGERVGVVDWVAGNRRLRMRIEGRTDHSGATPMSLRRDALVAASEVVLAVDRHARAARELVGTVGEFVVEPGALTAVPGAVNLSVDVRSTDVVLQERLIRQVIAAAEAQAASGGMNVDIRDVSSVAPILLPSWLRQTIVEVGREVVGTARSMTSGAGHDAAIMARRVHAGMIFVPCADGVSHSPAEWASAEDLGIGTQVLAESVLAVDQRIAAIRRPWETHDAGTTTETG